MILDTFNNFHNRLQFTMVFKNDRKLSFMDLMIEVVNDTVILDWFHKETFSGRVLLYLSNHPHKIGTIYNLVNRASLLSHPSYQQKNLELSIRLLLANGYPTTLIFKTITERLKNLFNNKLSLDTNKITVPKKLMIHTLKR